MPLYGHFGTYISFDIVFVVFFFYTRSRSVVQLIHYSAAAWYTENILRHIYHKEKGLHGPWYPGYPWLATSIWFWYQNMFTRISISIIILPIWKRCTWMIFKEKQDMKHTVQMSPYCYWPRAPAGGIAASQACLRMQWVPSMSHQNQPTSQAQPHPRPCSSTLELSSLSWGPHPSHSRGSWRDWVWGEALFLYQIPT